MPNAINDLKRHSSELHEKLVPVITNIVKNGWYVLGPECQAFEEEFAAYCGSQHSIGVANGTDALELALRALNIKQGDRVVTVANAGMYSTIAIMATGALPLFADIDRHSLLMSPAYLATMDFSKVAAIVVTHLYGKMADMPAILKIAQQHNIPVVEDCAQAHGATLAGRKAGQWGVMGCFSFYPTKNLGALGDGGAVVTDEPQLAAKIRQLRQYGWQEKYNITLQNGRNSRLDELQAAVLRVKLPYLDQWNQKRRDIAATYNEYIQHPLITKTATIDASYVGHLYVIQCQPRADLQAYLKKHTIASDIHYPLPDYQQVSIQNHFLNFNLTNTQAACQTVLTLPCFPEMRPDEARHVAEIVNSWSE